VLAPVLNPIETTLIVLIVAIFILLQREDLRDRLIRLFGANDLHKTTIALDDAAHRLSRYFLSQLAINAAFGAIIAFGLFLIGVPSPILWGILGALLRFVPYIGFGDSCDPAGYCRHWSKPGLDARAGGGRPIRRG
jgi:predicted PurR-regulated permease PerM